MPLNFLNNGYFAGTVGIGTNSPDGNLEVITNTIVSGASDTVNNVLIGLQAANRPTIILDTADTTYTNRTWNITNVGSAGKLFIGRNGLDVMVMDNSGNVGIGATAVTEPGFWYDATNKYLSISHWATPPTPAALLHLSDNANNIDVPQIRIEGRENPGDTKLDISVKDPDVRFNLIENTPDANVGYGLMIFKTNAVANSANPTRGGFNFQTPAATSSLFITNEAKVGIGTSSPIHPLYVDGDIGQTDGSRIWFRGSSSSSTTGSQSYVYSNGLNLQIKGDDNVQLLGDGGGVIAHFDYTGKVGISTTLPKSKLQVDGGIQMADDTDTASADKVGTMRYRTATDEPVPVTGIDLVTNGDLASSTGWGLQNSAAINTTTGIASVPGAGSLTSTAGNWSLYQANVMAPSKTYKLRFQARRDAGPNANMYAGWGYTNQFNQTVTADWVQYQVVFTTGTYAWHELTFGGVTGTTFEVKDIAVVEVTLEDASYADMCMQTGASTYEWVNIVRNTY